MEAKHVWERLERSRRNGKPCRTKKRRRRRIISNAVPLMSPRVQMDPSHAKIPRVGHPAWTYWLPEARLDFQSNFYGASLQSLLQPYFGFTVCGENLVRRVSNEKTGCWYWFYRVQVLVRFTEWCKQQDSQVWNESVITDDRYLFNCRLFGQRIEKKKIPDRFSSNPVPRRNIGRKQDT